MITFLIAAALGGAGEDGVTWPSGVSSWSRTTAGVTCYAVLKISNDGSVYNNSLGSGPSASNNRGDWLDAGYSASDFYVETHSYGGSPGTMNYSDGMATRVQLNTERSCGVFESTTSETHTCSFTIDFYDAASGGNLVETKTFSLSAFKDTP
jgi:hypothetical protein